MTQVISTVRLKEMRGDSESFICVHTESRKGKQVPSCTAIQAMASKLTSPASVMGALPHFNGLKVQPSTVALPQPKQRGRGALGARCDFIGSSTNIVSTVTLNNNGGEHKLDVVRGEVRVGSVGEQEGHDRAEAGSPRLGAADRRPCRVHLGGHVGLRHQKNWTCSWLTCFPGPRLDQSQRRWKPGMDRKVLVKTNSPFGTTSSFLRSPIGEARSTHLAESSNDVACLKLSPPE
ncbi:hypothetical protein B296_00007293 [Ensete ventricosum]|uniref:Uncharacterized protein n=1 Tax=Ensete ventricosum TaxID=4639 RepID=A0A427AQQ6_ENSVE|nr:hypothetical protein B296_00007293 [Ensete ventricosum]